MELFAVKWTIKEASDLLDLSISGDDKFPGIIVDG